LQQAETDVVHQPRMAGLNDQAYEGKNKRYCKVGSHAL
jgi:hypothetical protein